MSKCGLLVVYLMFMYPIIHHTAFASTDTTAGVSTTSLVAISGTCGLVALILGFVAGSREERSLGYQPVPSV